MKVYVVFSLNVTGSFTEEITRLVSGLMYNLYT